MLTGAKKHIPRGVRKQYIPCWTPESENLLREYDETGDQDTAEQLLNSLQHDRRNRWVQLVESMDFTRSSRQAWRLLKRLDEGGRQHQGTPMDPDRIAQNIIQRGSHVTKYQFETYIRKKYQDLLNSSPKNSDLSSPFTVEEITMAIKTIKTGKAAVD